MARVFRVVRYACPRSLCNLCGSACLGLICTLPSPLCSLFPLLLVGCALARGGYVRGTFPPSVVCMSVHLPRRRLCARLFLLLFLSLLFVFFVGLCLVVPLALFCWFVSPFSFFSPSLGPVLRCRGIPWTLGESHADEFNSYEHNLETGSVIVIHDI